MSMSVLVEPLADGAGYRASTGSPLNLTSTGPTPEAALDEIGRQAAAMWERGARWYAFPTPPLPRRPDQEVSPEVEAEVERLYQEALVENRARRDREAEEKYGIIIDHPAP